MPEVWICTSILNDRGIQGLEEMEAAGRFTTGPWGAPLYCYESLGSTNDEAKRLARAGAPARVPAVTARRSNSGERQAWAQLLFAR